MKSSTNAEQQSLKASFQPVLLFVVFLWIIKIAEIQFNFSLHFLGVYPLTLDGIVGIVTGPLIHGSFEHLAGNSLALLILFCALFFGYPKSAVKTTVIIWLGSGLGTWLFARDAWHFGASGITHGLFFFLLVVSILRKDKRSVALMMIAFFMYGGMIMSIFPREVNISFEYHLFGAIFGVLTAILFRHSDPKMMEKTYDWEGDESSETDLIGDEWQPEKRLPVDSEPVHEQEETSPGESPNRGNPQFNEIEISGRQLTNNGDNKRPSDI